MKRALSFLLLCPLSCSSPEEDLVARGEALFTSTSFAATPGNYFSCAHCHDARPGDSEERSMPGAPLAGVTQRPSYWGGQEDDLLEAVNACRSEFMVAPEPLEASDADAVALYEYLVSLEPGDPEPAKFSVVRSIRELPRGDAERGLSVYERACSFCHGEILSGKGRLPGFPVLPDDAIYSHQGYDARSLRLVFIEKVRHGGFLGYPGRMPPFSLEVLDDESLSDLLEALGVTGE
jgi:thiosulfate dehydrogenase